MKTLLDILNYFFVQFSTSSIIIIFSLISIFVWLSLRLYKNNNYPYLKEEVRKILYSWNETFFGPLFTNVLDKLYISTRLQVFLFCLYFTMCYLIKILQIIFFLNFILFHGDLRYVFFSFHFLFLAGFLTFSLIILKFFKLYL
jgi:hypothetical protein